MSALATVTADRRAVCLAELDRAFGRWLGVDYDLDAIHATLAVAAVNRLDGDPAWLLIVGGPGNAKTETVSVAGMRSGSSGAGNTFETSHGGAASGTPPQQSHHAPTVACPSPKGLCMCSWGHMRSTH